MFSSFYKHLEYEKKVKGLCGELFFLLFLPRSLQIPKGRKIFISPAEINFIAVKKLL
jgi:hypothetical protein